MPDKWIHQIERSDGRKRKVAVGTGDRRPSRHGLKAYMSGSCTVTVAEFRGARFSAYFIVLLRAHLFSGSLSWTFLSLVKKPTGKSLPRVEMAELCCESLLLDAAAGISP
ncbi:hypothetical protein GOBAR_DD22251 [Gossypium barbadense]|nr:hypothetical protein GOBAR_DD22251 [Gossypium barbadense]